MVVRPGMGEVEDSSYGVPWTLTRLCSSCPITMVLSYDAKVLGCGCLGPSGLHMPADGPKDINEYYSVHRPSF
jgi:hypothetical protein